MERRKSKRDTGSIDFSEVFRLIDEKKTLDKKFELSEEAKKYLDELEKELNIDKPPKRITS